MGIRQQHDRIVRVRVGVVIFSRLITGHVPIVRD